MCVMIRAVFFHYKLLCSSVELSGLHRDFGQLGVAHPGCHPPGTKQCRHRNTSTGEHREPRLQYAEMLLLLEYKV